MFLNSSGNLKDCAYVDGYPCILGNIARFIVNSRNSHKNANCVLGETINDKERSMSKIVKLFVCVDEIQNLLVGYKLLVDYNFHKPKPTQKQRKEIGLSLEVPMGHEECNKMMLCNF